MRNKVAARSAVFGIGDGAVVRKIVTSPNYSSDGFVAFVFSLTLMMDGAGNTDDS